MTSLAAHTSTGSKIEGFLSYSHKSDSLLDFAGPLQTGLTDMIKLVANREIEIFLDRENIAWGQRWQSAIDNGLESSSVLFVVATTHYLDSDACRDEFTTFLNTAKATGREQAIRLILPIMPIDASEIFSLTSEDPIARAIAEIQFELIEDAVIDGVGTAAWRHAMRRLARRFMQVVNAAEASLEKDTAGEDEEGDGDGPSARAKPEPVGADDKAPGDERPEAPGDEAASGQASALEVDDDDRGIVDLVSDIEDDLDKVTELAKGMSSSLTGLSGSVKGVDFNRTPSARELKTKFMTVAQRMKPHAKAIGEGGLAMRDTATQVDVSLRKLVALQLSSGVNTDVKELRGQLQRIQDGMLPVHETGEQMKALLDSMVGAESASSAMRQALKPMRTGLVAFGDAARIMTGWGPDMVPEHP